MSVAGGDRIVTKAGDTKADDDAAFAQALSRDLVRAYGQYVQDYPWGRHIYSADFQAWISARRQNTVQAYRAYLKYFPQGKFVEEANAAMQ